MKLIYHKKTCHDGTILQIVLIVLMVIIVNLTTIGSLVIENSRSIQRIKTLDENRLVELAIITYYKETIKNGLLLSDEITIDDYHIYYTVDDMFDYYLINTEITHKESRYSFILKIDLESLVIKEFTYQ